MKDSIIMANILKCVIVFLFLLNLTRAAPTPSEQEALENPSSPAVQRLLRRLFRNSGEMDQTGFHEQETESQDFPSVAAETLGSITSPVIGQDKKALVMALNNPEEGANVPLVQERTAQNHEAEQNVLQLEAQADLIEAYHPEMTTVSTTETEGEFGRTLHDDLQEGSLLSTISDMSSENCDHSQNEKLQVSIGASNPMKTDQSHSQSKIDSLTAENSKRPSSLEPLNILPPPFFITKSFYGRSYIYQLHSPTSTLEHQPIIFTDKELTPNDQHTAGLNKENIFGPPLPLDLIKVQEEVTNALKVQHGLKNEDASTQNQLQPNIFMFFKSFPFC